MSSTALGAEKAIIFISDAHEKFYYEKLKEVRYQDVYAAALRRWLNREKKENPKKGIDAIREAIKELERAGYIVRSRERDEKGRLRGADYVIFEQPQPPTPDLPTLLKCRR